MTKMEINSKNDMTFEKALSELEVIVRSLESGSAELDKAIELYTRGVELKNYCQAVLEAAKLKVQKVVTDGKEAKDLQDFDAD